MNYKDKRLYHMNQIQVIFSLLKGLALLHYYLEAGASRIFCSKILYPYMSQICDLITAMLC
jgi:hypothetical protein